MAQALVTLLAFAFLAKWSNSRRTLVAVAAVVLIAVFSLTAGKSRLESLRTTRSFSNVAQDQTTTNSFDWRFGHWHDLLEAWRKKPLIGYGLGTTSALVTPGGAIPHSDVMRLLVETGIVGFVAFGMFVVALVIAMRRTTRAGPATASYGVVALAILIGALVHCLAENVWSQTAEMYALAIVVGCALGLQRSESHVALAARTAPPAVL
jgi:O-antigen ligase